MIRRNVLAGAFVLVLAGVALARPGGGESYSGGGGHGGGGGSDTDIGAIFELIYWAIRLTIEFPQLGLPLLGGIGLWIAISAYRQHKNKDWDSGPPVPLARTVSLDRVRRLDPDFSQIVFEDFAFRLFSTAHRARHGVDTLATVAPYVSPEARAHLAAREPVATPVVQVVVGAMRAFTAEVPISPVDTDGAPPRVTIGLELEANIATATATFFTVERWWFVRDAAQRTKPPGAHRGFPCPNCGAPWQSTATGTQQCASCSQIVDNGRFDWLVDRISLESKDARPPTLTTEVPERGTDLPTYRQRDVVERFWRLSEDDPAVNQQSFEARIALIYRELAHAWSKNELTPIRGFVSDGLYDYLSYWIEAYRRQGLRNQLTDMRITKTELAKLVRDRWYHSITIRLWATGKDYVVRDATGDVVRGSRHRERPYSEYWTLIRSAERRGPPHADRTCGNCGAPLEVTMAGACTYCAAHVTGGEFDWVVSKIEQDDSYRG